MVSLPFWHSIQPCVESECAQGTQTEEEEEGREEREEERGQRPRTKSMEKGREGKPHHAIDMLLVGLLGTEMDRTEEREREDRGSE